MHPDDLGEADGRQGLGEQEVARGGGGLAVALTRGRDLADCDDPWPGMGPREPGDVVDDLGAADLDPAVIAVGGFGPVIRRVLMPE
jgi:hypothetical protein